MKVSLNTIKQYIDFELPVLDEVVAKINSQLGAIEEIIDLTQKYKDATIVKIVESEKHSNADRLSVCKVDIGSGELVQVVCGAPNVRADMWAVWLPPESIVPSTYDTEDQFKLGARELRGVMSHGMLAAGDELGINDDHDGIVEIVATDIPKNKSLTEGASFADIFGLDDTIIDIENKMFTHRPDLFGQLGVAREIAGIFGQQFTSPEWYTSLPQFSSSSTLPLEVFNETYRYVPRFMAVVLSDVEIQPSPLWLQIELMRWGSKAINNIVDITNYVMLLTSQPTHAYDYDKLRGHKLGARMAGAGERITLLNGKSYELSADDIVIADAEGPIGLGGIMGGSESEVSAETKNIVLEVATFDMYAVRKSAMRHGVFTDALTRFNKGQSPLQNERVLNLLTTTIAELSPNSRLASEVTDLSLLAANDEDSVQLDKTFVNDRLGLALENSEILTLLANVEIAAMTNGNSVTITPPFWRTDLELAEDIVEEVGRLYGFDKLPRELPRRSTMPAPRNRRIAAHARLRELLTRAGGNEVLTYSFVHEKVLKNAGQDTTQAFELSNALSPDLQYYRLSLVPSLLDKVSMNSRSGYDKFMLYELGKAHHVEVRDDTGLPHELPRVAGVWVAESEQGNPAYYHGRRVVDFVCESTSAVGAVYTRLDEYKLPDIAPLRQMLAPFEPTRSSIVTFGSELIGVVGEPKLSVTKNFKLPPHVAMFELFGSKFDEEPSSSYKPLSRYQSVRRDVSFIVPEECAYAMISTSIGSAPGDDMIHVDHSIEDIYQAEGSPEKTITMHFTITPYDRTLSSEEANAIIASISEAVCASTGARIG